MNVNTDTASEHLLTEELGYFNKTIYECRHCGTRSPDLEYFNDITCPPEVNETHD